MILSKDVMLGRPSIGRQTRAIIQLLVSAAFEILRCLRLAIHRVEFMFGRVIITVDVGQLAN